MDWDELDGKEKCVAILTSAISLQDIVSRKMWVRRIKQDRNVRDEFHHLLLYT